MKHIKGHLFSFLYAVLLIGFTIYILLDAFVIQRRYVIVEDTESSSSSSAADESSSAAASNAATITENRYQDEHIQIVLTQYREWDTDIYVADITLSSADYLKTAFADNAYGKNITQKTSEIAQAHQAVLAINGDYYSARSGYVLRNGTLVSGFLREFRPAGSGDRCKRRVFHYNRGHCFRFCARRSGRSADPFIRAGVGGKFVCCRFRKHRGG